MSHFTVMVHLTEQEVLNSNINEALKLKLQPFHEYESTGTRDQYVIKVDETEQYMTDYNTDTVDCVFDRTGENLGSIYSSNCRRYWKRANEFGISSRDELILPTGFERKTIKVSELYTFEEFLKDWHGYSCNDKFSSLEDGRFYRYTNPNAKWDWWQIGGRWDGRYFLDQNGEYNNIIQRKNWDITSETIEVVKKYSKFYDKFSENIAPFQNIPYASWDECLRNNTDADGKIDYELARNEYHSQEYKSLLKRLFSEPEEEDYSWLLHDGDTFYNVTREEYIKERVISNISTFAVLDADGWHEKGEMGWFASVSNENANWHDIYLDKIRNIPDNDYLVIVDCHI